MQSSIPQEVFGSGIVQPRGVEHTYFISGPVKNDDNIMELIKSLKFCGPNDVVNIFINSEGGDLYTTMQIVNSMRACAGTVATHADGLVASAGSLIFFAGDMLSVADLTSFLIHNGSMGMSGKASDVQSHSDHSKYMSHKLFHSVYEPFFSSEEIDKVLQGVDIHLGSEQVIGRINKVCDMAEDNNNNESVPEQKPKTKKSRKVSTTNKAEG